MPGFNLNNKTFYITGVANKKSVATFSAKALIENGARVIFSAQNKRNLDSIKSIFPDYPAFILDIEQPDHLMSLKKNILRYTDNLDGFLHSMAFANFGEAPRAFHETSLKDYLQACHISSFSLIQISNELIDIFTPEASIVTISISNTKATSYGYLGPIKSMLESSVCFLAKSLSQCSSIRVNSVAAGPLKTSASAGIPDYINNYLYSEALTLRKKSLQTSEVANTVIFLLSNISSGINSENIIVDLGINSNYFDQDVVRKFST